LSSKQEEDEAPTTLTLKKRTLKRLGEICKKNLSYDQFLNELLDSWEAGVKR